MEVLADELGVGGRCSPGSRSATQPLSPSISSSSRSPAFTAISTPPFRPLGSKQTYLSASIAAFTESKDSTSPLVHPARERDPTSAPAAAAQPRTHRRERRFRLVDGHQTSRTKPSVQLDKDCRATTMERREVRPPPRHQPDAIGDDAWNPVPGARNPRSAETVPPGSRPTGCGPEGPHVTAERRQPFKPGKPDKQLVPINHERGHGARYPALKHGHANADA